MDPRGSRLVRELMSPDLVSVSPDMPLPEVRRLLETRDISAVPVLDAAGALRGIVSLTDLQHGPRGEGEPEAMPVAGDVMERRVVTVRDDDRLAGAAATMIDLQIHRVVVTRQDRPVAVLSTRDVARAVFEARVATPLGSRMTSPVQTIDVGDPIEVAIERLKGAGVRGLVVVSEQRPVGVFTQLEAIKARGLRAELQRLPVEEVMSYETICLDVTTPLYRVAAYMRQMRVRRILAVEHHRLVGILSGFDLLREVC